MSTIVKWFLNNSVAANLLMWILIIGGAFQVSQTRQEVFPEIASDFISVSVPYPGAAPQEVEEGICIKVEEEIQDIEGIKRLTSSSFEGLGVVNIEIKQNEDVREVLDDVKSRVDAIDTFPEEAEQPVIAELLRKRQVISVALFGEADQLALRRFAQRIRDDLARHPKISQVQLANAKPYEISVDITEKQLRRYGLSFAQVAQAINNNSIDLPGGVIKSSDRELLLRTKGQRYKASEFEDIVLATGADGSKLRLGQVAKISDSLEDTGQFTRFDGKPSVLVQVFRVGEEDAIEIASAVKEYLKEIESNLPQGIELATWQDDTINLRGRISLLVKNGQYGIFLVFLILALFLRLSLAFWVALGIPISFLGAFFLMPAMGISINLISLFGFILVLGIVVDDAIVVGESVYLEMEKGSSPAKAAIDGTVKIAPSVVFSVLTTVVAFYTISLTPGNFGVIFGVIAYIVIATLLFSLLESIVILPVHLGHDIFHTYFKGWGGWLAPWDRLQQRFALWFKDVTERIYKPTLEKVVQYRYTAAAIAIAVLIVTMGFVKSGLIKFSFFPEVEDNDVSASLTLFEGASRELTTAKLERLERAAFKVKQEVDQAEGKEVIQHIAVTLGSQPMTSIRGARGGGSLGVGAAQANVGEVSLELVPAEEREISAEEVERRWREYTGAIPEATDLSFASAIFSSGDDINVQVAADKFEVLQEVAQRIKEKLGTYVGVFEISDNFPIGKDEIQLKLTEQGKRQGVSLAEIGRQVRQGFYGAEAQRLQRGRDEVKVMVRYSEAERKQEKTIEQMHISLPSGEKSPLSSVAELSLGKGYSSISRDNRKRVVNVKADVDESVANIEQIKKDLEKDLFPDLKRTYPEIYLSFEGSEREQRDAQQGLLQGFVLALIMIYALMAIPFKSYFQPLIIMSSIPFGLIGAILGHLLRGIPLTIMSVFGLVALTGVVVNDGLILVNYINRARSEGSKLIDAVMQSGMVRFRPVVITSITTFAGLTPIILERSLQAQFLIPIAVSLGFGVIFATGIILLLVPAGYLILEDIREKVSGWLKVQ